MKKTVSKPKTRVNKAKAVVRVGRGKPVLTLRSKSTKSSYKKR